MADYVFYFDASRCTGCKTCELACKDYHDLPVDYAFRKVYEYSGGSCELDDRGVVVKNDVWTYYTSMNCNHCDNPACMEVCPTGAMHKDDLGFVSVDHDKCVGCKYCQMACPYNVPAFAPELGQMRKCDGCSERVAKGENPICVDACPLYAIDFGPADEMKAKYGESEWTAPLPDPELTQPTTIFKGCSVSKQGGTYEGELINTKEVQ